MLSQLRTETTFAEAQQTGKLLGRERLMVESVCLSPSLSPSLDKPGRPNHFFLCLFVFLDFLLIWGQLILVRNRCLLPFSPACLFRKKSIVVFNIIKFICSLGVSML